MSRPITALDVWADSGAILTPDPVKIDTGWIPGEQPPAQWHNWLDNQECEAINSCIEEINLGITFLGAPTWFDTDPLAATNHDDCITEIVDTLGSSNGGDKVGNTGIDTPRKLGDLSNVAAIRTHTDEIATALDLLGMSTAQTYPDGQDLKDIICRRYNWNLIGGIRGSGWAQMWANNNEFGPGTGNQILDIDFAVCNRRLCLLVLDATLNGIRVYDVTTGSQDASYSSFDPGWEVRTMVSDGDNVYVSLENPALGNLHRVEAFVVSDLSWDDPDPNWAGGIVLPASGASVRDEMAITPHGGGNIVHLNSWVASATPTPNTPYVTIIAKDGSTIASGAGDAGTGAALRGPIGGLVVDNSTVYFCTSYAPGVTEINTATIADLTLGTGSGWPYNFGTLLDLADLVSDGEHIISVWQTRGVYSVKIHKPGQPEYSGLDFTTFESGTFDPIPGRAVCDGTYLWLFCNEEFAGVNQRNRLYQFDLSRIIEPDPGPAPRQIDAYEAYKAKFSYCDDNSIIVDQQNFGPMAFDGRDIWAVWTNQLALGDGIIRRLPRSGIR